MLQTYKRLTELQLMPAIRSQVGNIVRKNCSVRYSYIDSTAFVIETPFYYNKDAIKIVESAICNALYKTVSQFEDNPKKLNVTLQHVDTHWLCRPHSLVTAQVSNCKPSIKNWGSSLGKK